MSVELIRRILVHFERSSTIPSAELFAFIHQEFPTLAEKSISWKINQLKNKGIIEHYSRGIYSLTKKNEYTPYVSSYLKRIFYRVERAFPFLNFCISDSRWFNEFMTNQMFKYQIVVETEKDATEYVFNYLTDSYKNVRVFHNPDRRIIQLYLFNHDEEIIVKPLISEAPLIESEYIRVPSIEKLLIDSISDVDLFSGQQGELDYIYKTAFGKYRVNINKLKRYARRRNKITQLEDRISRLNF
jgi:hypothetical protein